MRAPNLKPVVAGVLGLLLAVGTLAVPAYAHEWREVRHDRRQLQRERRDLRWDMNRPLANRYDIRRDMGRMYRQRRHLRRDIGARWFARNRYAARNGYAPNGWREQAEHENSWQSSRGNYYSNPYFGSYYGPGQGNWNWYGHRDYDGDGD